MTITPAHDRSARRIDARHRRGASVPGVAPLSLVPGGGHYREITGWPRHFVATPMAGRWTR